MVKRSMSIGLSSKPCQDQHGENDGPQQGYNQSFPEWVLVGDGRNQESDYAQHVCEKQKTHVEGHQSGVGE